MVASGRYTDIYVNKSISTATSGSISSGLRPDIIARTKNGKYVVIEVVSPSQTLSQLQIKMQKMKNILGSFFDSGDIIDPDY